MSPAARRWLLRAAKLLVLGVVVWYVHAALRGSWTEFRAAATTLRPDWALVSAAVGVVLATYALLVDVWRRLATAGAGPIPFWAAARVWSIASLGKYVPGKLWQVAALGAMAQRYGVSPVVAAAAALLSTAINMAAAGAVVALAGPRVVRHFLPASAPAWVPLLTVVAATGAVVTLLALPWLLPRGLAVIGRRMGRPAVVVPRGVLWYAVGGNLASWVLYGLAFWIFARALDAGSAGDWPSAVAVFTGSYLAGYLALVVPGGIGVREVAMIAALTGLGLATTAEATVLAFASRLWLTVLEIVPGACFLARDALVRTQHPSRDPSS